MKPLRQPKTLTLGGTKYKLAIPWRAVSDAISEGPFYRRVGEPDSGYAYMPDAGFLHVKGSPLSFMHRVQL
jgi:hypothetical protein